MSRLCLSLTGRTIQKNLDILEEMRKDIDLAELRADCLDTNELDSIRRFPALAGLPVILTVRREADGGYFKSGEGSRVVLLSKALAFAKPDKRQNFAYIDIEEDLDVPSLEEAARVFGTRIIRSFHDFKGGSVENLEKRVRALYHVGDEIVKGAVMCADLEELRRLAAVSRSINDKDKIIIGMGDLGHWTRILTEKLGSYLTYACIKNNPDFPPAGPGQLDVQELLRDFRYKKLNNETKIYGITGFPLKSTASPAFYNGAFSKEERNAVYIRFPSPSIESFLRLADELGIEGASVTVPHKEAVLKYLNKMSASVRKIGACNTIKRLPAGGAAAGEGGANSVGNNESAASGGWSGFNTDVWGFKDSLAALLEKEGKRKKRRAVVLGAGGAARAVAAALSDLKIKTLILNRNMQKARELAERYKFEYGALDINGIALMQKYNDIIVQTTSLGNENTQNQDPASLYHFRGSEVVIDIIYKPEKTLFLQRALAAGCAAINGFDMLQRQARYQYERLFGSPPP